MSIASPIHTATLPEHLQLATLAGGCFWCIEAALSEIKGIVDVESGYAGSECRPATYDAVCTGKTHLAEVVHVVFDPAILTYDDLLKLFFVLHDPTTLNRQGNDVGTQYRSAIFTHNDAQAATARELKSWAAQAIGQTVVTHIEPFVLAQYTRAEDEHQEYFAHHPENAYCQSVIPNKLAKIRANFTAWLK